MENNIIVADSSHLKIRTKLTSKFLKWASENHLKVSSSRGCDVKYPLLYSIGVALGLSLPESITYKLEPISLEKWEIKKIAVELMQFLRKDEVALLIFIAFYDGNASNRLEAIALNRNEIVEYNY